MAPSKPAKWARGLHGILAHYQPAPALPRAQRRINRDHATRGQVVAHPAQRRSREKQQEEAVRRASVRRAAATGTPPVYPASWALIDGTVA